ncbi:MAG: sugar ABC transporter substrate-binding protein [Firmicutes bacterium]|nr:sugar ABC transporter substrate-binding protein [Bacillota bacterium]
MKKSLILISLLILSLALSVAVQGAKATTITYGRWASMEEAENFKKLIATFEKANPDIKVQAEFLPWNAYWDKLKTTIMSGEAYDVISFSHLNSAPYVSKEALYDMSKLEGAKQLLKEMPVNVQGTVIYKGKIYGMPVGIGVRAFVYNKDLFEEAGVPYLDQNKPLTWDEFMVIGEKLTKTDANGKVIQYASNFHTGQMWEACVVQAGGKLLDNNTRPTKVTINTPEGIAGLTFFTNLLKKKINVPFSDQWNGPWGSPDSALNTRKVAIIQTGPWSLSSIIENKINFATCPCFMGNTKKRATFGYTNFLSISKNSKKAQAAWQFIKWCASAKGQLEFTKTGDLPANTKALAAAKANPVLYGPEVMNAFFSEQPYVINGPMLPSEEFNTVVNNIINDMLQFKITPAEAAKQIEEQGNAVIKRIFAED